MVGNSDRVFRFSFPKKDLPYLALWVVAYVVLPFLFFIQIVGTGQKMFRDVTQEMSSSKAFGKFLQSHSRFNNAVLLGEPDLRLESLPYYVENRIYIPREGRYGKYVRLTKDNKSELSLAQLLRMAFEIKEKEKVPVLIALGHFGLAEQTARPFVRTYKYNNRFTWTEKDLVAFQKETTKIAEFKSDVKNERYEIYELRQD